MRSVPATAAFIAAVSVVICTVSGCPSPKWNLITDEELVEEGGGVFHTVMKGETLYRICRTYRVDLQTVAEENDIDDVSKITEGLRLFIPGAKNVLEVPEAGRDASQTQPQKRGQTSKPGRTAAKHPPVVAMKEPEEIAPKKQPGIFMWPVKGVLVSRFGVRGGTKHQGIDISAPQGTPVYAAASGRVLYSDSKLRGYGNLVLISHSNGFMTVYAHNKDNLVREGDSVSQGQKIATVGATGNAEGPHVHFEIREGAKARNPLFFLP
jgi:murein DD-endopeptidase MepM/ murein hydrolase activator NlpD